MKNLSASIKVYIVMILVLALSNAFQSYFLLYQGAIPEGQLPAPQWVVALANAGIAVFIYGGIGLIGLWLARKLRFADIWDPEVNNRKRFLIPALAGAGLGMLLVIADVIFSRFNGIGYLQHPPFPASILASLSAGIGEEIIFRLFFIPLWTWLISSVILRGKGWEPVFWIISVFSAIGFAFSHIPALMFLYGFASFTDIPPVLIFEIVLLNGAISMFAAYYFRKYGFLAAAGVHFWADIVWHVIYGLLGAVL